MSTLGMVATVNDLRNRRQKLMLTCPYSKTNTNVIAHESIFGRCHWTLSEKVGDLGHDGSLDVQF